MLLPKKIRLLDRFVIIVMLSFRKKKRLNFRKQSLSNKCKIHKKMLKCKTKKRKRIERKEILTLIIKSLNLIFLFRIMP